MWFDNIGGGLDTAFQNLLLKKTSVLDIIPLHRKGVESSSCSFVCSFVFLSLSFFYVPCFFVLFSCSEILKLSNLCRN